MRGDTICSFFSAARRTNQEAPPLLSGFIDRRLAPPSGAAELAALRQSSPSCRGRLASSRPDKGGGITALHREYSGHIATRASRIYRRLCHSALDAVVRSFRAATRNPEIPGHGITQDARTVRHYSTHCHLQKLDPASECGVTLSVIPRYDAESRITRARTQDARAVRPYSSHCHLQKLEAVSK